MVEGKSATIEDRYDDPIEAVHHISGRDAERLDTLRCERCITEPIAFWMVAHVVGRTIDLDRELRPWAVEIEHVPPDRMLPAKPELRRSRSQHQPQADLGCGHRATKTAGSFDRPAWRHSPPPPAAVPLLMRAWGG